MEIVLSALILGPLFTAFHWSEYFSSPVLYRYFLNIFGIVSFYLPGVFEGNWVNGSLWTVPFEMFCYLIMFVWVRLGLLQHRWTIVFLGCTLILAQLLLVVSGYSGAPASKSQQIVDYVLFGRGSRLLVSFCFGVGIYLYRYQIPYSPALACAAAAFLVIASLVGGWHSEREPISNLFLVAPAIYITAVLGLSRLPRLPFFHTGDYSYGIYLYGWPISISVKYMLPESYRDTWLILTLSLPLIVLFSWLSWHQIEKPILQMRRKFSFVAKQRLQERGPDPALAGSKYNHQPASDLADSQSPSLVQTAETSSASLAQG